MSETTEKIRKLKLPCVAMRQIVAFPGIPMNLDVARTTSKRACEAAVRADNMVFLVCQNDATVQSPTQKDCHTVGTVAKIKQLVKGQGTSLHIIVEPIARAYVEEITFDKYLTATVMEKRIYVEDNGGIKGEALMRDVRRILGEFIKILPKFSKELWFVINSIEDPGVISDFVASNVVSDIHDKQMLLEEFDPITRLQKLLIILEREKEILLTEAKIQEEVRENMDRNQRDYYLREQLKVIQSELGEDADLDDDIIEYRKKIADGKFPKEVAERLVAKVGTKDYGTITAELAAIGDVKITRIVNRNMFNPVPNVDSAIVNIKLNKNKYQIDNLDFLSKVIRAGFSMRRKTLTNCLKPFGLSSEQLNEIYDTLGFDKTIRGESLSPEQFVNLSNCIYKYVNKNNGK